MGNAHGSFSRMPSQAAIVNNNQYKKKKVMCNYGEHEGAQHEELSYFDFLQHISLKNAIQKRIIFDFTFLVDSRGREVRRHRWTVIAQQYHIPRIPVLR